MKYLITYRCEKTTPERIQTDEKLHGLHFIRDKTVSSYGYAITDDFVGWLLNTQKYEGETYFILNVEKIYDDEAELIENMKGL